MLWDTFPSSDNAGLSGWEVGVHTWQPIVRVFTRANENYSLSIRVGDVVLMMANPLDEYQHWIKEFRNTVKDEEVFPSFAPVNKATGQAIKHSFGGTHLFKDVRMFGRDMSFVIPGWKNEFMEALTADDWILLRRCGLSFSLNLLKKPLDWQLLNTTISFWNPLTCTFFFPRGEMNIMQEEVSSLMNIRQITPEEEEVLSRMNRLTSLDKQHFTLFHKRSAFTDCLTSGYLNLNIVWQLFCNELKHRPVPHDYKTRKAADELHRMIFFLFGGLFLFTDSKFRVSGEHVLLLFAHYDAKSRCLVHPILAHLFEGLSCASVGGTFFGSPWLLQEWLIRHFPSICQINKVTAEKQIMTRCFPGWLIYFSNISEEDVDFLPYGVVRALIPARGILLKLIGASSFVPYNVHRCSRMFDIIDLRILPLDKDQVTEARDHDNSESDEEKLAQAYDTWNKHARLLPIQQLRKDDAIVVQYCNTMQAAIYQFVLDEFEGMKLPCRKCRR